MRNSKRLQNRRRSCRTFRLGQVREAVLDVLLDRQMREQREALKYVSDAPLRHRKIGVLRGIEQDAVADRNPS